MLLVCVFALVGIANAHRPLTTDTSCGTRFSEFIDALNVPDPSISWSTNRILSCKHPVFWLNFTAAGPSDFYLTVGTPRLPRFARCVNSCCGGFLCVCRTSGCCTRRAAAFVEAVCLFSNRVGAVVFGAGLPDWKDLDTYPDLPVRSVPAAGTVPVPPCAHLVATARGGTRRRQVWAASLSWRRCLRPAATICRVPT
jgi:hypothetical protein